jgi:hypothetical protein
MMGLFAMLGSLPQIRDRGVKHRIVIGLRIKGVHFSSFALSVKQSENVLIFRMLKQKNGNERK